MQCLLQVKNTAYFIETQPLKDWHQRLIVSISQWKSVLDRSISLSCYIWEQLVVTQFCRLVVPYVAA